MKNRKLYKVVILLLLLIGITTITTKPNTQSIAPSCFEKEDCRVSIKPNYCNVQYDCISGRCYSTDTKCNEQCADNKDNDLDGYTDCRDTDCYTSIWCGCNLMSKENCYTGRCYCEPGKYPQWWRYIEDDSVKKEECRCVS